MLAVAIRYVAELVGSREIETFQTCKFSPLIVYTLVKAVTNIAVKS
jgi:hypothetical protein